MHPSPRFIPWQIVALSLLCCAEAFAFARFDFEQPYFVEEPDKQCKDHSLIKLDDTYHLFYIESFPPEPGEYLRTEKWLGHMISEDLKHWTHQDSILPVSEVPFSWEEKAIWAPKIIENPNGPGWLLYYTGVNDTVTQQTGGASSLDLYNWTRFPENPIYHPGFWSDWINGDWSNCRDPEIFKHPDSELHHLLNTATTSGGLGAISRSVSLDLITWTDQSPYFVNDSDNVLESVQLVYRNDLYHLFFTEQNVQGTSHMASPYFYGGYNKDDLTIIDVGNAPEVSVFVDADVFSRHDAINSPYGPLYYYRFDLIDFDTPDNVPAVVSLGGIDTEAWTVVFGNAFENQPTWGDNPAMRGEAFSNMEGNSYLATYENFPIPVWGEEGSTQGDNPVGLLRGTTFTITGDRIRLLVGGGQQLDRCFVGLVRESDDRLLFMETGENSYSLDLRLWNLETLLGESVYLVVADLAFREWGHISVDGIEEYNREGFDPQPPSLPLDPGPLLEDVLDNAGYGSTAATDEALPAAKAGRLLDPHPNPFNPRSYIRYELEHGGQVELNILDIRGRRVRTLFSGDLAAGPGFFVWDGRDDGGQSLASGFYFARLQMDGEDLGRKKLNLLR